MQVCLLLVLSALFWPGQAMALELESFDAKTSFLIGFWHPVLATAQLLLVLATGLWVGQQGRLREGLGTLRVFIPVLLFAMVVSWFWWLDDMRIWLLAGCLLVGGLLMAAVQLARPVRTGLVIVLALALGMDSAQPGLVPVSRGIALFGSVLALALVWCAAVGLASMLGRQGWRGIVLRVLGSWLSAAALLVLVLAFRPLSQG